MSRNNNAKVQIGDELSDNELDQVSGGTWGKTINPFDGTDGGSDDWGKTVDPFEN